MKQTKEEIEKRKIEVEFAKKILNALEIDFKNRIQKEYDIEESWGYTLAIQTVEKITGVRSTVKNK